MLDQFINEKVGLLQSVPDGMLTAIDKLQANGYRRVSELMSKLATDEFGDIIPNQRNLNIVAQIELELRALFNGQEYTRASVEFAKGFNQSMEATDKVMTAVSGINFSPSDVYRQTVVNAQRQAVTLLTGEAGFQQLYAPVQQMLSSAISTRMNIAELNKQIADIMLGSEGKLGSMASYASRIVADAFAYADRNYTMLVSEDLNITKWMYQGGEIATTRPFCSCRSGKIYTKDEIQAWGKTDYTGCGTTSPGKWKGRNVETNERTIFTVLGGYNCRHALIPYE